MNAEYTSKSSLDSITFSSRISAASYWISCFRCFIFGAIITHIFLCLWFLVGRTNCVICLCISICFVCACVCFFFIFSHLSVTRFWCLAEALISIFGNLNKHDDIVYQMLSLSWDCRNSRNSYKYTFLNSFKMFSAQSTRNWALKWFAFKLFSILSSFQLRAIFQLVFIRFWCI